MILSCVLPCLVRIILVRIRGQRFVGKGKESSPTNALATPHVHRRVGRHTTDAFIKKLSYSNCYFVTSFSWKQKQLSGNSCNYHCEQPPAKKQKTKKGRSTAEKEQPQALQKLSPTTNPFVGSCSKKTNTNFAKPTKI